ncbi:MAG: choice-of-anchor B family protein [Anaerolineales bacterium]|nr:choice-of-anchor B family protein [Anaerolineales bacterium]
MQISRRPARSWLLAFVVFALIAFTWLQQTKVSAQAEPEQEGALTAVMEAMLRDAQPAQTLAPQAMTPCVGGFAGSYPCENIDLMAFMPLATIGGGNGNDIWGWTDPLTDKEYALMGRSSGTSFVDISDPVNPIYLGNLPTHTSNSTWRDIKVYNNYAFIVSEASGHGIQIFDLTQLRNVPAPPATFSENAHYSGFGKAHNIVINEDSGYAYGVGTDTCAGGLHMVNIQNPLNPVNSGCFSSDGYTHDAQCVIYTGPDAEHQGKEICFNSNEDTLTIVDVTNKANPVQLSRTGYAGASYTHQGWVEDSQTYYMQGDELDESNLGHNTRTYIWNISNLDAPQLIGNHTATTAAIDHNMYVKGSNVYQSNYRAGLRILDISDIANANLAEKGYFDIYPANNNASFNGTWSNYPYFDSGIVVISGIEQGLYIVRPTLAPDFSVTAAPETVDVCMPGDAVYQVEVGQIDGFATQVTLSTSGQPAGTAVSFSLNTLAPPYTSTLTVSNTGAAAAGSYDLDIIGMSPTTTHTTTVGLILSDTSATSPLLQSPANGATDVPLQPTLTWTGDGSSYTIEIATDAGFTNIIESATVATTSYTVNAALVGNTTYYWRVTGSNACGSSISDSFTFTTVDLLCSMPNIAIPDNNANGVSNDLTVSGSGSISDLDVSLIATHTYVGDLSFKIEHIDTGTSVTIIDRPGFPASANGCSNNDINATLDDEAATPVENECAANSPTINGSFVPNNALSAFDGEDLSGTWRITAVDHVSSDSGTLVQWCLQPITTVVITYGVALSPDATAAGMPGSVVTHTVQITNTGSAADSFTLDTTSDWAANQSTFIVALDSGETTTVTVAVTVPVTATLGASDTATVTATSHGDNAVTAVTHLTTTIEPYKLYLPVIQNEYEAPQEIACTDGMADIYPCQNVNLLSFTPLAELGAGEGEKAANVWGWTDPETDKEYVLLGLTDKLSFIDASDPLNPTVVGFLPNETITNPVKYRDVKVYQHYAFIIADEQSHHGMQVFDLEQLRGVSGAPVTFTASAYYDQFGNAHNIFINEDTGYAYVVRNTMPQLCSSAVYMMNIQDPLNPTFAGCYETGGAASDTMCVVYDGPDAAYQGRELCLVTSDDEILVADVTDKGSPATLATLTYPDIMRAHLAWLTEDHRYFVSSDMNDEMMLGLNTRIFVWDFTEVTNPQLITIYQGSTPASDHNVWINGDYAYVGNFRAGVRILDLHDIENTALNNVTITEAAYFDIYPENDNTGHIGGVWAVYPFFESGVIAVSDKEAGLYLLRPLLP